MRLYLHVLQCFIVHIPITIDGTGVRIEAINPFDSCLFYLGSVMVSSIKIF